MKADNKSAAAPVTLFLGKTVNGTSVSDIEDAASCNIDEKTQLVCGGKAIGVSTTISYTDMSALAPPKDSTAVTTGFSVDANNVLHWKNDDLKKIPAFKKAVDSTDEVMKDHYNGEAQFGLFKDKKLTEGKTLLFFQLGCPGSPVEGKPRGTMGEGTHHNMHEPLVEGVNKVVPL